MTHLHSLITALLRLLSIYFGMSAFDNAVSAFFTMVMIRSTTPDFPGMELPDPWAMFLPMVGFHIVVALIIFFAAPKLARVVLGSNVDQEAKVPWHETLLFCMGALIISWAFVRFTDTIYNLMDFAAKSEEPFKMDTATMTLLLMTAILFGVGCVIISKFHRISAWMASRRNVSEQVEASDRSPLS